MALEAADGMMPKDDVRALIDQLVRPAPGPPSPRDAGGQCGSPLSGPAVTLDVPRPREAELQGARWQLLKATEHIDNLNAELSDLRRSVMDLKGSLSQSEADKANLVAELEKQLLENGVLAAKCAQLESEKGSQAGQVAALQAELQAAAAAAPEPPRWHRTLPEASAQTPATTSANSSDQLGATAKLVESAHKTPDTPQIGRVSEGGGGAADFVEALLSDVRRLEDEAVGSVASRVAAEHAAGASGAQRDKVARIRADLYCLLHRLTLYECGGSVCTTAPGSAVLGAVSSGGGSSAATQAAAPWAPSGSSVGTLTVGTPEPAWAYSKHALPPERAKEPAGVQSCCEVGAGMRGKEMASGADGAASDLIAQMASPCRARMVATPQRTRVTNSYVVRASGAPVQTVPMAPPVAAVVSQPRWPSGIATTGGIATAGGSLNFQDMAGGSLNPTATPCLGTSQAYRQFVGSPRGSNTSTPVRQRVCSSSPTRRCSNSIVTNPSSRASLPSRSPMSSRASLPARISLGHGVVGNALQVNSATPHSTMPTFSASAGHPGVWLGCVPPSCTSSATGGH